jgi:hypothetical protein
MRPLIVLVMFSTFGLALGAPVIEPPGQPFAVIVAPDVNDPALSRDAVSLIYRRKQTLWKDGRRIQPVNLPAGAPLRRAFSQCVLGQPPEGTEDYWREMYFHGVLPPHVVASEEAMVLFVIATPGAIGYVSACPPDARVVVVLTIGDVPNCPKRSASCAPLQE